jgi:hypothetical protein
MAWTELSNNMISLECSHKLLSATRVMANKDRKKQIILEEDLWITKDSERASMQPPLF